MIIKQGTEDGMIEKAGPSWPPSASAGAYSSLTRADLGGANKADQYYLERSYFRFNTSSVSSGATIISARLWFKLRKKANADFNLQIQIYQVNGDWNPLDTGDWGCGNTLVGTKNYVDLPAVDQWFSIDLNPSCINKGGITAFETRGDHESGTAPTGENVVEVYTADSTGNEPYLEITLSTGAMLLMFLG